MSLFPSGKAARVLALSQGIYFLITGLWPLAHVKSFMWVTGPKIDTWLVKTVGILVTLTGSALCVAVARRNISPELILLGMGTAAGLGFIDVYYAASGIIAPIYFADALLEALIIAAWLWLILKSKRY